MKSINYVKNENRRIVANCINKHNEEYSVALTNYMLKSLGTLQEVKSTKNSYEINEKRILLLIKDIPPYQRYLKVLEGVDEVDTKSFFTALHKGIVGLIESFDKKAYVALQNMLTKNTNIIKIFTHIGYQPCENCYVLGNKLI